MEKCQVKDCGNENPEYIHISHEDGDKAMCNECYDFYFPDETEMNPTDYVRKVPATKSVLAIVLGMSILIPYALLLLV